MSKDRERRNGPPQGARDARGAGRSGKRKPETAKPAEAHDRHHAELRRKRRDAARIARGEQPYAMQANDAGTVFLYGLHTVRHALANPARKPLKLHATKNGLDRLAAEAGWLERLEVEECEPRVLDRLVGEDAVHQGLVLESEPLSPRPLSELGEGRLVLILDQVTDPHNVGAILRSAVAFGSSAVITTARHSPAESGVLAKAASGALDMIDMIQVRNLAEAMASIMAQGYATIGLDSEAPEPLETVLEHHGKGAIALVLGAEGKGLRQKTRETCTALARLDMPGAIKSLNVSNAAALSLYAAHRALGTAAAE